MTIGGPDWGGTSPLAEAIQAISIANMNLAAQGVGSKAGVISRQGYEIALQLVNATPGATPTPVKVEMIWQDGPNGNVVGYRRRWIFSGDSTGAHNVIGRGPSRGRLLTMTFTNAQPGTPNVIINCTVLDVGRTYTTHDWRTLDYLGPVFPGYTLPETDVTAGMLCNVNGLSIGAGLSATRILPLYSGRIWVKTAALTSGPLDLQITTDSDVTLSGPAGAVQFSTPSGTTAYNNGFMPFIQCALLLRNFGGAALTAFVVITCDPA